MKSLVVRVVEDLAAPCTESFCGVFYNPGWSLIRRSVIEAGQLGLTQVVLVDMIDTLDIPFFVKKHTNRYIKTGN
ncbi:hypothetical protein RRG08_063549 [Elysia crispata]|uniref:Uncharacterized protein n=1 Tax=Elysia crispata TaxID=231223 RepID=A0AAE1D1U5_9GAST|nr:hypothetical protein RRG08_063549 [Elysia crispata]